MPKSCIKIYRIKLLLDPCHPLSQNVIAPLLWVGMRMDGSKDQSVARLSKILYSNNKIFFFTSKFWKTGHGLALGSAHSYPNLQVSKIMFSVLLFQVVIAQMFLMCLNEWTILVGQHQLIAQLLKKLSLDVNI